MAERRRAKPLLFIAACALLSTCATGRKLRIGQLKDEFRQARNAGHVEGMSRAVCALANVGAISVGMAPEEVERLLGPCDTTTGIYCPGGVSWGYGDEEPNARNYHKFYWVHLRPDDYLTKSEGPTVLQGWRADDLPAGSD